MDNNHSPSSCFLFENTNGSYSNDVLMMTMIEDNNSSSSLSSSSQQQQSQNPYPCTVFFCRPNSHPFQERRIPLTEPVKVGRAVARLKALQNNAIFDCKVLSRQHAKLWYENGKFYLQDTKSSNGTFVNNQRLGKCNEESLPFEIFSGDIVQFGVDVTENNRKTTHNCIIIEAKLYHSDGSEALPRSLSSHSITQQKDLDMNTRSLYELAQYLQEALQREQQLEQKLSYLQNVLQDTQKASNDGWQAVIDEDRLLARINALEDQIRAYHVKHPNEDTVKQEIIQLTQTRMKYEDEAKIKLEQALLEKTDAVSRVRNLECTLQLAQDELKRMEEQNEQQKQEIHHLVNQIDEQRNLLIDFEQKLRESQTRCTELDYERNRIESDFQEYFLRTQKLEELQEQQQKIMNNSNNEQSGLNIVETRGRFRVHSSSKDAMNEFQKQQTDLPANNNVDYDNNDDDDVVMRPKQNQNDEGENYNVNSENTNDDAGPNMQVNPESNENGNEDDEDEDEQEKDLDNVIQSWYNFERGDKTPVVNDQQSFLSQHENKTLSTQKEEDKYQSGKNHDVIEEKDHKLTNTNEIKPLHPVSLAPVSPSLTTVAFADETKSHKNDTDELNARLALKEKECVQYKCLLENEEKVSELIRQHLNETKERLNDMEEQYYSERNRLEVVTRECSVLRIEFQQLKEQYDQLLKQKQDDSKLNNTTESPLVTKQKELNDLNGTILTKQNELDKLTSDIEHLKVTWSSLSDDLKLSTRTTVQSSSSLPNGAYPSSLISVKTTSSRTNTNGFSSLSPKISSNSESETSEHQMNDFVQLRDECAQLKNRIVKIENDMKSSRQENLQLSSEYNRLQDTYEELQTLKNALESSEIKIKHNLTDSQKEVDQYQDKLEESRSYIQKLENHCAELQTVLEETANEYEELSIRTKTISVCSIVPVGILAIAFVAAFYPILSKITATY